RSGSPPERPQPGPAHQDADRLRRSARRARGRHPVRPVMFRPLRLALALALATGLAGCETLDKINPFNEKKPPLPGERHPVFPDGVRGVDYSTPMGQPSNSNIVLPSTTGGANAGTAVPGASAAPGN